VNYTQFYKEVRQYASNYACRLFRDEGARLEAVDKAMDLVVDRLLGEEITVSLAKRIAHDRLINIAESQRTATPKNLKVRLSKIPGAKERAVMALYSQGYRQRGIEERVKMAQPNISRTISKWIVK